MILLGRCPCVVAVVMWELLVCLGGCIVPYVDEVGAVTVMRVLLFVLHVCMLRECEGARVTEILVWAMYEVW